MTDHDPIRAQAEVTTGWVETLKVVQTRARETERAMAETEAAHNAALKIVNAVQIIVRDENVKLARLREEAERKAKGGR